MQEIKDHFKNAILNFCSDKKIIKFTNLMDKAYFLYNELITFLLKIELRLF